MSHDNFFSPKNKDSFEEHVRREMYLVVGYRDHISSTYNSIVLLGLYYNIKDARERIQQLTGRQSQNLCRGNNYCCWINKVCVGDFFKTPTAGANDDFCEQCSFTKTAVL